MRFSVTATAECFSTLTHRISVEKGGIRVDFVPNEAGQLGEICVSTHVSEYHDFLPSVTPTPGQFTKAALAFPMPPQAESLIGNLQYLESATGFWLSLKRLDWQGARYDWVPESEAEEALLPLKSISQKISYPERHEILEEKTAQLIVDRMERDQWLAIPLGFFREGRNDFEARRFINAFYNFYFVLEDIYGAGRTKNRAVVRRFQDSPQLVRAADSLLVELEKKGCWHLDAISSLRGDEVRLGTTSELFELIVWMRGNLHHFSRRSSTPKGHPFNHNEYESLAYVTMGLCLGILPELFGFGD